MFCFLFYIFIYTTYRNNIEIPSFAAVASHTSLEHGEVERGNISELLSLAVFAPCSVLICNACVSSVALRFFFFCFFFETDVQLTTSPSCSSCCLRNSIPFCATRISLCVAGSLMKRLPCPVGPFASTMIHHGDRSP